ncbi:hypothetical protein ACFLZ6_01115, partial [Nanoarchaeota archaeon]
IYGSVSRDDSIKHLQRDFGESYRAGIILLKGYNEINLLKDNTASAVNLPPKFVSFEVRVSEKEFYEWGILFNVARNNFNEILIKKDDKWRLLLAKEFFYTGNDNQGKLHVYTQEMMDQLDAEEIKQYLPFAISDTRNPRLREINPEVIEKVKKQIAGKKSFFSKFKKKKMPKFNVNRSDFEEELIDDPLFERLATLGTIKNFFVIEKFFKDVVNKGKKKK